MSPRRHVRWQLVAPFALLSVAIAAAGTYMATTLVGRGVGERFNAQLVEASRGVSDVVVRRERTHLEWLRSIAFTDGVGAAVDAGSSALEALVLPLAVNVGADLVEVVAPDGSVRLAVELQDSRALTYAPSAIDAGTWPAVRDVLAGRADERGDKFSGIVPTDAGTWIVTAAPISGPRGLAGVAVVGTRIGTLAQQARTESFADVAFLGPDGQVLGSTLIDRGDGQSDDQLPEDVAPGDIRNLEFGGRPYRLLTSDLVLRGTPVGRTLVFLTTDLLSAAQDRAAGRMTTLFTAGFALVVVMGLVVAHRITAAVSRLVRTTRRVTVGDLTARAPVEREDELGELGRAFNVMTDALRDQLLGAVSALVSAIDARDAYTRGHSLRVGHLAALIGSAMGLDGERCHHLTVGGYLHDIGKIGVRDDVLLKPGALDEDERTAMQSHPGTGFEILRSVGLPDAVLAGVLCHHERLDGSGYPQGLRGEAVPLEARIVAVADVYDACITDRPYRRGMPVSEVLRVLREEVEIGRLDATVVDHMRMLAPSWERIWRNDERMSGFTLEQVVPAATLLERAA